MADVEAVFVNFKNVLTRNAFQIILEVPAEAANSVLSRLGYPTANKSIWVRVTPLNTEKNDDQR